MIRREGTSKSNSLCAVGGFAPKLGWAQIYGRHPKINHSSGFTGGFLLEIISLHNFLMRTRLEPPQCSRNLFSTSFGGIKVRPRFFKTISFTTFLTEIKLHSFHNPNYTARGCLGHDIDRSHTSLFQREPWLTVFRGQQVCKYVFLKIRFPCRNEPGLAHRK